MSISWSEMLRRHRRLSGKTQAQLAAVLSVDQATLSRWERGIQMPDPATRRRIHDLLVRKSGVADFSIVNLTRRSPNQMLLFDRRLHIYVISDGIVQEYGVDRAETEGSIYRYALYDGLAEARKIADEAGFFDGEPVSIDFRTRLVWLDGTARCAKINWTNYVLSDGSTVGIAQMKIIGREDYDNHPAGVLVHLPE